MMIHPHPTEMDENHQLRVVVAAADGQKIFEVGAGFTLTQGEDSEPGEVSALPVIVDFKSPPLNIPSPGGYSIDVLVDQQHADSLSFLAKKGAPPKQQPSESPSP